MISSMVRVAGLERTLRIDAEHYSNAHDKIHRVLTKLEHEKLSAVADVFDGNHAAISEHFTESGVPYLRGQDLNGYFLSPDSPVYISERVFERRAMSRSHMFPEDVLISIVGTVGSIALVPEESGKLTGSCKIAIARVTAWDPYYVAAFLMSTYGQQQIERLKRGSVQMGLILEDFDQILIVAPDKQVSLQVRGSLRHAQNLYDQYKSEKAAAEELTGSVSPVSAAGTAGNSWRMPATEAMAAERLDPDFLRGLAPALSEVTLEDLSDAIFCGVTPAASEYSSTGAPVLKVEGIGVDGVARPTDSFASVEWATINSRASVRRGDVVILSTAHSKDYIGKAAVVVDDLPAMSRAVAEMIVVRPREKVNSRALAAYLNLPSVRGAMRRLVRGNTAHLYPRDLRTLPVPQLAGSDVAERVEELMEKAGRHLKGARSSLSTAVRAVESFVAASYESRSGEAAPEADEVGRTP